MISSKPDNEKLIIVQTAIDKLPEHLVENTNSSAFYASSQRQDSDSSGQLRHEQKIEHLEEPMQTACLERAETAEEKDLRVRKALRAERAAQFTSLAALSLLLVASCLFLALSYTGWNAIAASVALFCASVAGYPSLQLLWYALSSQMFRCWSRLEAAERFRWGQKGASLVHSLIMASVGVSIALRRDPQRRNVTLAAARDDRVAAFIGLELGYLLQDSGMEIYKQFAFGRSFGVLHWLHQLMILTCLPWYFKDFKGDYFFGAFFLWNAATVPLQLRWFQAASGMQRGILYHLNNAALLLSFLTCRIFMIPTLLHVYGASNGWAFYQVPFRIPAVYTISCAALIIINSIWLFQLLQQGFKQKPRSKLKVK